MTKQEIFNKAVEGLHSQNWQRCVDEIVFQCRYSGPNNTHCALGWVFPELSKHEGHSVAHIHGLSYIPNVDEMSFDDSNRFYAKLQHCHDNAWSAYDMRKKLRQFAKDYNLVLPEVLKEND